MDRLDLLVEKQAELDDAHAEIAELQEVRERWGYVALDRERLLREAERLLVDHVQCRNPDIREVTRFLVKLRERLGPLHEPERRTGSAAPRPQADGELSDAGLFP